MKLIDGENFVFKDDKVNRLKFSVSKANLTNLTSQKATYPKMSEIQTLNLIKCILKLNNINTYKEDKEFDEINRCTKGNIKNIYIEFYDRFFFTLFVIPLTIITGFLILFSKLDKNYNLFKFTTFLCGLLILILSIILNRYITDNLVLNIIVYSIPVISAIIIYLIFLFTLNHVENKKLIKN